MVGDDATVALAPVVSTALLVETVAMEKLLGGDGHGDPLALSAYAGVMTPFLLLRPESEVLVQLTD